MKRFLIITLLIVLCISITSCGKKEEYNDSPTEISLYELFSVFDSHKKIIFAIIDENDEEANDMLKQLGDYQKTYKNNVYYVDSSDFTDLEKEYTEILLSYNYDDLRYYVVNEGQIENSYEISKTFLDIKKNLGTGKYDEIDIEDYIEERNRAYNNGIRAIEEGSLTTAYNYVKMAIPKKEAKELINSETFYVLNNWETMKENGKNCTYFGMYFVNSEDQFYISKYNGACEEFDKSKQKPILYNYYLKDNVVYARKESSKDNVKYKKMLTIVNSKKDELTIDENGEEYILKIVGEGN